MPVSSTPSHSSSPATCRSAVRALFLAITALTGVASAADWDHFRGNPANDGISKETDLLKQWPQGGPKLAWSRFGLPVGHATPVVCDGVIYLASRCRGKESLIALRLVDGGELWRADASTGNASPAVAGGKVFVQGKGTLSAFDARNGRKLWSVDAMDLLPKTGWENRTAYDSWAGSPVAAMGKVFWVTGHERSPVIALHQDSGKLAWASSGSKEAAHRGWGSPALVDHDGRKLLLAHTGWHLLAVDPNNGKVIAEQETMGGSESKGRRRGYSIGNVPVYDKGLVYSSAHFAEPIWTTWRLSNEGKFTRAWHTNTIRPYQESMICVKGKLFGRSELAWEDVEGNPKLLVNGKPFGEVKGQFRPRGKSRAQGDRTALMVSRKKETSLSWERAQLACQDMKTGKVLGVRSDIAQRKAFCGPVMAWADDRLYMRWSWNYPEIYLLEADETMAVRGKLVLKQPEPKPKLKKDWVGFSSPVIADGKLIVRYITGLYVYDISARQSEQ